MNCKLQKERSNTTKRMNDEREGLLLPYKVVEGKWWQENSSEGLNKRPVKHLLMWTTPETLARTHYMFQMVQWLGPRQRHWKRHWMHWFWMFQSSQNWKVHQEETLVHLIHVQEGSNTTLFGPWGEDNKGNKRILLQLGNNMGGYLFLLFLGLRGCMEGYK